MPRLVGEKNGCETWDFPVEPDRLARRHGLTRDSRHRTVRGSGKKRSRPNGAMVGCVEGRRAHPTSRTETARRQIQRQPPVHCRTGPRYKFGPLNRTTASLMTSRWKRLRAGARLQAALAAECLKRAGLERGRGGTGSSRRFQARCRNPHVRPIQAALDGLGPGVVGRSTGAVRYPAEAGRLHTQPLYLN